MNPSTAQARVLVDEFVRGGVRHAVLCPGSRNAPLSFALHAAASAGRITLHVRVDERSAGFLALGLSTAGVPAVLACTSGTAAANFHPAVLEAGHAGVGLLVLTADRPPELRDAQANQVVDQHRLYGSALRFFAEFAVAQRKPGQNAYWRSVLCQALAATRTAPGRPAGPVQLNVPLADPLVPDLGQSDPDSTPGAPEFAARQEPPARPTSSTVEFPAADWPEDLAGRPDGQPWTVSARPTDERTVVTPSGRRGVLLVAGQATAAQAKWGERHGWPVIAETGGVGARGPAVLAGGNWLLGAAEFVAAHRPDQVVCVGRPTVFRQAGRLLADRDVEVLLIGPDERWPSPGHRVRAVGQEIGDPPEPAEDGWLAAWQHADRAAVAALHEALDGLPWRSGMPVARTLLDALPPGALLTVGSSNPTRDVALGARATDAVRLHRNRGVAGIDGLLSTAIGAAIVHQQGSAQPTGRAGHGDARRGGRPDSTIVHSGTSYALVGDLTFLHDVNGLLIGPDEPRPDLTIVVFNDDGGGIFSLLEQGAPEHAATFERVFGTPHHADVGALCAGYGVEHRLIEDAAELRAALTPAPGIRVLEIRSERGGLRDRQRAVRAAVESALRRA